MINKIHLGDCVQLMKKLPDNSVNLTVTSPPYDNLRTYKGKIKDDVMFDEYFSFPFVDIVKELYRVTTDGGIVVWVVNDQVKNGGETGSSFRQALKFQELGFKIYDTMIYHKNGAAFPESGRYSQVFEYMFVFLKGKKPKTVNLIKDKPNRWAGSTNFGTRSIRTKDGELKKMKNFVVGEYGYRYNVWQINNGAGYTSKDKIAFKHPACVDIETECLTFNGWKKYNEVNINDTILSYNISKDQLEWDKINNVHISDYNGEVYSVNGRRLSIIVTPNHRNVLYMNNKIFIKETTEIKNRHNILTSCPNNSNKNKLDDNISYLLGLILTDGHIKENSFHITQDYKKNSVIFNKIIKCLNKLEVKYSVSKRRRYYTYSDLNKKTLLNMIKINESDISKYDYYNVSYVSDINILDKDLNNKLFYLIPNKKITNKLFELNNDSLSKILEGVIDGDGSNRSDKGNSFVITGKYEIFHDNIQILSFLCGNTSDIIYPNNSECYTQITKKRNKLLRNSKGTILKKENFSGVVWCPEVVKNGTWVARRNGKIFITGNSFPESLAEDHILSWSNEGDIVLDPMCGAGTTCKMAKMNNRNFIGIDINQEYVDISNVRVDSVTPYTIDDPNEKVKFIISKEQILANRRKKK